MTKQKTPAVEADPIASWDDEGGAAVCGDQSTCKLHGHPNDDVPETKSEKSTDDKKGRQAK